MSRKDYVKVAELINNRYQRLERDRTGGEISLPEYEYAAYHLNVMMNELASIFSADNDRFNITKFREACMP